MSERTSFVLIMRRDAAVISFSVIVPAGRASLLLAHALSACCSLRELMP